MIDNMMQDNEREMWDTIVAQDRNGGMTVVAQYRHIDLDTFEADLPGELDDLMSCDWCGKPEYDLIPFYGEDTNPTDATYLICEECNNSQYERVEYGRSADEVDEVPF